MMRHSENLLRVRTSERSPSAATDSQHSQARPSPFFRSTQPGGREPVMPDCSPWRVKRRDGANQVSVVNEKPKRDRFSLQSSCEKRRNKDARRSSNVCVCPSFPTQDLFLKSRTLVGSPSGVRCFVEPGRPKLERTSGVPADGENIAVPANINKQTNRKRW